MSMHSSKHSLVNYPTITAIIILLLIGISTPATILAGNLHVINFRSPNLYPEGITWDPKNQHFLVGSLHHRTISTVSATGVIQTLISDPSLPENVTVLGLTVDSHNNRILAAIHALKPLPPFNALAAYDLISGHRLFLSHLPSLKPSDHAIANDVAVDLAGNAYVTNSGNNFIWKVNYFGESSIFSNSPKFTEYPVDRDTPYSFCGLNGIAYVSNKNGYLLVAQTNTGKIFKVDADDGNTVEIVKLNEDLTAPDGVALRSDGVVLVVSPEVNRLWFLKSNDEWREGVVFDEIDLDFEGYPTSVVVKERDNKGYVLNGYVKEGILGNFEVEGFRIVEVGSLKESEGVNVWVYVMMMIGIGMVCFLYWWFQMGKLVKNMDKKDY
jgi:sugar lactone lactonase YvrE